MPSDELDAFVEQCHAGLTVLLNGDASPWRALFSHRDDVTLGNPFGPFVRGFEPVIDAASRAAALYRDGVVVACERIATYESSDLACVVEVERFDVKVGGGSDLVPVALRVTSVFRREDGEWKVAHRHADPITTPQSAESVIQVTRS